jgi:hypothetical protein
MGSDIEESTDDNFFGMGPNVVMTSDNEVEIRVRSMEGEVEREVFCQNIGGHWDKEHNRFFHIPEERVDFQKKSMKGWPGWDRGHISKFVSKYDTTPIGRAKFLLALKVATTQYVELEKTNAVDENDDIVESRDANLRRMNSMDAFLSRMNSTIIQWRTYLASLNGDTLVLSNAKVDEFVAMVEHARKIHREGETDDTPTRKRKREEEEADLDHSPTFNVKWNARMKICVEHHHEQAKGWKREHKLQRTAWNLD